MHFVAQADPAFPAEEKSKSLWALIHMLLSNVEQNPSSLPRSTFPSQKAVDAKPTLNREELDSHFVYLDSLLRVFLPLNAAAIIEPLLSKVCARVVA